MPEEELKSGGDELDRGGICASPIIGRTLKIARRSALQLVKEKYAQKENDRSRRQKSISDEYCSVRR